MLFRSMDSQLMGEFEADVKELEADSWTFTVEEKFLKQLKKDVIKRQDVIYGTDQLHARAPTVSVCCSADKPMTTLS